MGRILTFKYALSSAEEAPLSAPILLTGSIKENLIAAGKLGYNAIEIHTRPDEKIDFGAVKDTMAEQNVQISAVITGRLNTEGLCSLIDDRPYVMHAAMLGMYQYIDMAEKLNTNIVLGWTKGNVPVGKNRDKYLKRLASNLDTLSSYAGERNVKIHAEVINRYEVNIFTTGKETMDFIQHWYLDNVYVHLDTFHMNIEETDMLETIRYCKDRLGYFHVADNTRSYPGTGQLPFPEIMQTLQEINYNGYVSVECLPGNNRYKTAHAAIEYLKSIV